MTGIERRIKRLEEKVGQRESLTLETLICASNEDPDALAQVEAVGPDDPLVKLICGLGQ